MSDCSCVFVGEYDAPIFYSYRKYKAKKEHKCLECQRTILKGERYEVFAGKWGEVGFCCYKTCQDCLSLRDAFYCDGWIFADIRDGICEHIREVDGLISIDCLCELTDKAREWVLSECQIVIEELNDDG